MSTITSPTAAKSAGLLARFDSPRALKSAAVRVRKAGYQKFDVYTPFPVHGMDQAMGLGRSKLGWLVAVGGIGGAAAAMGLQWYTNALNYPTLTGGKPYFSWQAFVPVTFELMVLGAAVCAVFGMFALNRLPDWYHPAFKAKAFTRVTDDGFFMVIDSSDQLFDARKTRTLLEEVGGRDIELLEE